MGLITTACFATLFLKTISHPAYVTLLAKIKARRNELGWTQADLGKVLRRPPSYVAKIEAGEQRVDLVEFYYWTSALRMAPVELVDGLFDDLANFMPRRRRGLI